MFNGTEDLGSLVKQAQQILEEISLLEVTGESGAGLVKITINGMRNCTYVEIDLSLVKNNDKLMLEELVAAAFNDAARRMDKILKEKMVSMSYGIQPSQVSGASLC